MEKSVLEQRLESVGLVGDIRDISLDRLRKIRRAVKEPAFVWIYCNRGELRPSAVDALVTIDSEIKRRMQESLKELDTHAVTYLTLEKEYGKRLQDIRRLAGRTCADELPECATDLS